MNLLSIIARDGLKQNASSLIFSVISNGSQNLG